MVAQRGAARKLRGKAEGKEQDALSRRIGAEQGMKSQEAAREQAAKAAELQARIEAFRANDPALDAVHGFNRPKPEQYKPDWKERKLADGSTEWFDINGGQRSQPQQSAPQGGGSYRDAIASIESAGSGDYKALGPQTKTGDRAYGRYQVMGANIPEWTKAALGRAMSPEEFVASPEAQDAVFDHRFGGYVQKYGPEGAARAWFGGEGGMKNPNARDSLGTSVSEYGRKFSQNMGGTQEDYQQTASGSMPPVIRGNAPQPKEEKPSSVQQRQRDLRELQASGQKITQGMAQHYMLHGKFSDKPDGAGGRPAKGMTGDVANKVGLYSNALRSAREWHSIVAEKGEGGKYTGGYNNMAAMSPQAKTLLNNAIRAKLRAESGASISPDELEGEVERYSARFFGGDATDIAAANNLLNDLSTQITSLVGKKGQPPANNDDDLIRKYLNP